MKNDNKLDVIDGETLADLRLPPTRFCVQTLLPQGVTILGGAPKIGKSWLILDLCIRIAKGEPIWNLLTEKGTTLYLCLEDTRRRVQERLLSITDDVPANAFFAVAAKTLADGLADQIREFIQEHSDTVLVAVDTFQMVRGSDTDISYASDYAEVRQLKQLADEFNLSILLVHHLRKQGDNDPLNKLSGTTGISGAVDAVFVLDKSRRNEANATLICTGRDIEYRELELCFTKDHCIWELVSDSADTPEILLPRELISFLDFMRDKISFSGSNSDLAEQFNNHSDENISAKALKQMMNKWRYQLEDNGLQFRSYRSNGQRLVTVEFRPTGEVSECRLQGRGDASDGNDADQGCGKPCVPCDPCVPVPPCEGV